jgi:hypothetical protein
MLEEMAAQGGPYDPYANGLATSENRQGGIQLHLYEQFEDAMDADEAHKPESRRPPGEPSPGADLAGRSPVPAQIRQG